MDIQKVKLDQLAKNPVFILFFLFIIFFGSWWTKGLATSKTLPTVLSVTRVASPAEHIAPFSTTIHDTATVQKIYKVAYALPAYQAGATTCPRTINLNYNLAFSQNTSVVQKMYLNPTGCPTLNMGANTMGMPDIRAVDASFLLLLTQALELPSLVPQQ